MDMFFYLAFWVMKVLGLKLQEKIFLFVKFLFLIYFSQRTF